ncbi:hypothetical protein KQX54_010078 [Cotesia glomerata]|uniref:Reverse transcriptase domain-containing protein n=1 Tax=Cotesia glomerata TaxID=32391 RepID=A0AAV7I8G9_COTGL|nr:hypothetical protein KQX54_010078 [Cotesia glomerata]
MAGVPHTLTNSQSLKRKAQAELVAPKNSTKKIPFTVRNSFSLEESYKKWEKTQKDNTNKQKNITPNIKTSDRRNSLPNVDKEGFQYPKNPVKINSGITPQMEPADTANQYQVMMKRTDETNEQLKSTHDTSGNASQNTETTNAKTYRPPPIFVQGEKAIDTIQALRIANIDQETFSITMSKGQHEIQAKNQLSFEKIKEVLIANNFNFYSFTPKNEKLKSLLLKDMSPDVTTDMVFKDLTEKNIPSVVFKKVSELKFMRDDEPRRHLIVQHRNQINFQPFQGGSPSPPATENTRSQVYRLQPEYHQQQSQWPPDENPQQQNWANITNQISELTNVIKEMSVNINRIEDYWKGQLKQINHKDPTSFFPKINRFLRKKNLISIADQRIKINDAVCQSGAIDVIKAIKIEDELLITEPINKLKVIGEFYQTINEPRYLNTGTRLKELVDKKAEEAKKLLSTRRSEGATITNFSKDNRAINPANGGLIIPNHLNNKKSNSSVETQKEHPFVTYDQLTKILKKLPNKTSSGPDEIPSIILKHLPPRVISSLENLFAVAYADDIIVGVAGKNPPKLQNELEELVNNINDYYKIWNLRMNPEKCETAVFRRESNHLSKKALTQIKGFQISTPSPNTNELIKIPHKTEKRIGTSRSNQGDQRPTQWK